jgi:hypothetical protein
VLYDGFYEKLIIHTMNLTFAYRFHILCDPHHPVRKRWEAEGCKTEVGVAAIFFFLNSGHCDYAYTERMIIRSSIIISNPYSSDLPYIQPAVS